MKRIPVDEVIDFIRIYGDALHLNVKVQDTATTLLRKYLAKKQLTGRGTDVWAAAFLQISCKLWSVPINARIINNVANIQLHPHNKKKEAYTLINKVAKCIMRVVPLPNTMIIPTTSYVDIVFAGLPSLPEYVRVTAYRLVEDVEKLNINYGSKQVFASTIVFLAAKIHNERIIETDCIHQLKISEVALRNCKRKLVNELPGLIKNRSKYKYKPLEEGNHGQEKISEDIQESIGEENIFGFIFEDRG